MEERVGSKDQILPLEGTGDVEGGTTTTRICVAIGAEIDD